MTAKYCLDTSGISNPIIDLPSDIHTTLWPKVVAAIEGGIFCWNVEIATEMTSIPGFVGESLKNCNGSCCLEVGKGEWPWSEYIKTNTLWQAQFKAFISEYNGNRKDTVGLNDLSIVALAKTLCIPVVSMERRNMGQLSEKKLRIPDLCDKVEVKHLSFNELCRAEGIKA